NLILSTAQFCRFAPTCRNVLVSFLPGSTIFILKMSIFAFAIASWGYGSRCSTSLTNTNEVPARASFHDLPLKVFLIVIEPDSSKSGESIFALVHYPIESGFDSWILIGRCCRGG